jgi:CBS domain-containing protein
MREILDVTVGELMSKPALTVTPDLSVEHLRKLFTEHDVNGFPVVNGLGALIGLVTRFDLLQLYLLPYQSVIGAIENTWVSSVGAIMARGVVALYARESAMRAIALMVEHGIRTIPVVEDSPAGLTVIGVITREDLMPALVG